MRIERELAAMGLVERDGRLVIADVHPARLTEYDREEIRAAHRAGVRVAQLAAEYSREEVTIRRILRTED